MVSVLCNSKSWKTKIFTLGWQECLAIRWDTSKPLETISWKHLYLYSQSVKYIKCIEVATDRVQAEVTPLSMVGRVVQYLT